jgi:hypothetical protein
VHFSCFETPNPDPRCQRSTDPVLSGISLSGNRRMKGSESLTFQNPERRCAMPRVVLHAVSVGPVATRDSLFLRVPFDFENAEVPSPDSTGSRATCPSNRRLRLNREIATRDFDVHATLALANPDMPICNGKWFYLRLRVKPLAPSPRSDDPRDFAILHRNSSRRFSSS